MARIMTKLRRAERLQDTHRLRSPLICPMVGDGYEAASEVRSSTLRRNGRGWLQLAGIDTRRAALVEARYRDWLDSRDRRIAA